MANIIMTLFHVTLSNIYYYYNNAMKNVVPNRFNSAHLGYR